MSSFASSTASNPTDAAVKVDSSSSSSTDATASAAAKIDSSKSEIRPQRASSMPPRVPVLSCPGQGGAHAAPGPADPAEPVLAARRVAAERDGPLLLAVRGATMRPRSSAAMSPARPETTRARERRATSTSSRGP